MKVLIINGSPRANGNTAAAISEICEVFDSERIETEVLQIGGLDIRGCSACGGCKKTGKCVFDDIVNEAFEKLVAADGLILASPVYYAGMNGTMKSFLDRLFYRGIDCCGKVGAAIAVTRRAGLETTLDQLNKYLFYSRFAIASSQYWNGAYGMLPGEVKQDAEGMQIMRTLAKNMAFIMKSMALGREKYGIPEAEPKERTNFIR